MRLTPRERQILRMLLRGQTVKQIAAELGISPHTVSRYMQAARDRHDGKPTIVLAIEVARSDQAG